MTAPGALALLLTVAATGEGRADTLYANSRYAFEIRIPKPFSAPIEADGADGGVSRSEDDRAEIRVFGTAVDGGFAHEVARREHAMRDAGWTFSDRRIGEIRATLSGTNGERIVYLRMLALCDGTAALAVLEYPRTDAKRYRPAAAAIAASFRGTAKGCQRG